MKISKNKTCITDRLGPDCQACLVRINSDVWSVDEAVLFSPAPNKAFIYRLLHYKKISSWKSGKRVYIDRASISKIEQCKRIVTDYELVAFSKLLGVSVNWLLGIEKE